MIGLVIVSHSHRLAEGVKELAQQMAQSVPIAAAGGLNDDTIGTSFERIQDAIAAVDQPDGVLVLMDLGSAVLTTELVLEMLDEEQRARVRLSNAPLVEGAIAAAVQSSLGASLDDVAAAARAALDTPKVAEEEGSRKKEEAPADSALGTQHSALLTIVNRVGLHARPAAQFVQAAGQFEASVQARNVSRQSPPVDARSIFGVLGLNARLGDQIEVSASGPQAEAALAQLRQLVDSGFGEELGEEEEGRKEGKEPRTPTPDMRHLTLDARHPLPGSPVQGVAASPGIAIGPALVYRPAAFTPPRTTVADTSAEWQRLAVALGQAETQLGALATQTAKKVGAADALIFEAQRAFLQDPALREGARRLVENERLNAAAAIFDVAEQFARQFEASDNDLLRQRAVDVRDVAARVVRLLGGAATVNPLAGLERPVILLARDLTPSETATLDPTRILGIGTALGGATSHTAILARSLGVPAIVGLGEGILSLSDGTSTIVDGAAGQLWVEPDQATTNQYTRRQADERQASEAARAVAAQPALTLDGHRVSVWANVGDAAAARRAVELGAEGVGLLRTEFLFLDRATPPTEDEQVAAYRAIAEAMDGRPVTVRTLDIGGDKPAPYLQMPQEENPFLGVRAIRLCLAQPELFKTQLRAILRVAAEYPLKVMFPMVALVEELRQAKALLAEAKAELAQRSVAFADKLETGIMVEVPAAALTTDLLAAEADFFSLGTNDLTQYTFAADRGNPAVAALGNALHPAILHQIKTVVGAAHAAGKSVSVCGEMGSDPRAVPLLVSLGIDTLSVNPGAVPEVKAQVRTLNYVDDTT